MEENCLAVRIRETCPRWPCPALTNEGVIEMETLKNKLTRLNNKFDHLPIWLKAGPVMLAGVVIIMMSLGYRFWAAVVAIVRKLARFGNERVCEMETLKNKLDSLPTWQKAGAVMVVAVIIILMSLGYTLWAAVTSGTVVFFGVWKMTKNQNSLNPEPQPLIWDIITLAWLGLIIMSVGYGVEWKPENLLKIWEQPISQQVLVFIPAIWLLASIFKLELNEIGGFTFFGYPVKNVGPGPKLIPWVFFKLHTFNRDAQQKQFPADPEFVFKGEDKQELPKGMYRPYRYTTGKPTKTAGVTNPLDIQMALEFLFFLRIQIEDPLKFIVKYGDLDKFWNQVRDTGDKTLNELISERKGVAKVIEDTRGIMNALENKMVELCAEGGVKVIESGLSAPDLTHDLSKALRDLGSGRAKAMATAFEIDKVGDAKANAAAAMITKTSEALKTADETAKAAYVDKETLSDKAVVIGDTGIAGVIRMAQALSTGISTGGNQP